MREGFIVSAVIVNTEKNLNDPRIKQLVQKYLLEDVASQIVEKVKEDGYKDFNVEYEWIKEKIKKEDCIKIFEADGPLVKMALKATVKKE